MLKMIGFVALLALCSPTIVHATAILDAWKAVLPVFTTEPAIGEYNPDQDLFTITSGAAGYNLTTYPPSASFGGGGSSTLLSAEIDENGVLQHGTFTVIGGNLDLGIPTDSLLLAGDLTQFEYDLSVEDPVRGTALIWTRFLAEITFSHPLIEWTDYAYVDHNLRARPHELPAPLLSDTTPITSETVFDVPWSGSRGVNTYVFGAQPIPEPGTIALLALGFTVLTAARRRRSASRLNHRNWGQTLINREDVGVDPQNVAFARLA